MKLENEILFLLLLLFFRSLQMEECHGLSLSRRLPKLTKTHFFRYFDLFVKIIIHTKDTKRKYILFSIFQIK